MKEIIKKLIGLVISVMVIHSVYIGYIRPKATLSIEAAKEMGQSAPRDLVVIFKDYEQEICLILMCWGCFLIFNNYRNILRHQYLFNVDFIQGDSDAHFNAEDIIHKLDNELPEDCRSSPLIQTLRMALWRYAGTKNVQNLSDTVESSLQALAVQQDSENSMLRYLIWAIPSIGFIGTVRGIGEALSLADQALAGDIAGMTDSLGIAFNSTLVALLISIVLMFLFHQLQRLQDSQILDTQEYCNRYLLAKIK